MNTRKNIHDIAREFLAGEGIKMSSTQSRAIFTFADWLLAKQEAAQQRRAADGGNAAPGWLKESHESAKVR